MSLRTRLLATSLAVLAIGLVVAEAVTYSALSSYLAHRTDAQLMAAEISVGRVVVNGGRLVSTPSNDVAAAAPGVWIQVRDGRGLPLITAGGDEMSRTPSVPALPVRLPSLRGTRQGYLGPAALFTTGSLNSGGPRYRVRVSPLGSGSVLVLAASLHQTATTLHRLLVVEALVGLAVLLAAAASGAWLVGLGLRPLVEMEAAAESIAEENLTDRLPGADDRTEVGRLAKVLNVMLARLEVAFAERRASEEGLRHSEERLRRFASDASHELRTPVANVRAYAELYRRREGRDPADVQRLMRRIEEEAARMGVLVEDLLLLTRLDQGRPLARMPVDLGAIATEAVDAARTVDPGRRLELTVEGSVEVSGDKDRMRQVVDNLLANIRTHTPPAAPAEVKVRTEGSLALLEVADRGPGVPSGERDRIFERFYRVDPSRARDSGGTGLGLSIVAAIATAHGGRACLRPRSDGGSVFRVEIPTLGDERFP